MGQDRMRDGRGGGEAAVRVRDDGDAVGGEDFERRLEGGSGKGMGVAADEQRHVAPVARTVVADRLADRQDVRLVEASLARRSALYRRSERSEARCVGNRGALSCRLLCSTILYTTN